MSQLTAAPDGAKIVINLNTPLYQAIGGQLYKLLLETVASQVRMSDGVSVETRINTIERALAANTTTYFADDIEARDALRGLIPGDRVIVLDAAGDETVNKGAATYVYMPDLSFRKLAEDESMDFVFDWDKLINKPASSASEIDLAVARQHSHGNRTVLDQLTENESGQLTYRNQPINDGKVWIAAASSIANAPDNLADGGLLIVNQAITPGQAGEDGE